MKLSKEVRIGLFAIFCLAVLVWGLNFLKGRNVFSSTNVYYAVYNRVDGLKPTNDVVLSGFKVGSVKDIKFKEGFTGELVVTLLIEKKYDIPLDSKIKLISSDIMGGKALRLDLSQNSIYHKSGDTLVSCIETGLLDQIVFEMVPIKDKVENLMESLDAALQSIVEVFNENNRSNLEKSLSHVEGMLKQLDGMMDENNGQVALIVNNIESFSRVLRNSGEDFQDIILNISEISDSLTKINVAATMAHADSVMISLNEVLSKINSGEGNMGMLIHNDTLYYNLEKATKNLELLLEDVKENPKRYVRFSLF